MINWLDYNIRNLKSLAECLADEIINCGNNSQTLCTKKRDELERVAVVNR